MLFNIEYTQSSLSYTLPSLHLTSKYCSVLINPPGVYAVTLLMANTVKSQLQKYQKEHVSGIIRKQNDNQEGYDEIVLII